MIDARVWSITSTKLGTAVGAGLFDAGALNESTFNKLVKKGVPIRELARFTNVTKPWIARAGLSDRIFNALQETLWEMGKRDAWIVTGSGETGPNTT